MGGESSGYQVDTGNGFIWIPAALAEKTRLRREHERELHAKRDIGRNPQHGSKQYGGKRRPPMATRSFIIWDGEGPRDTSYSLFGNSEGDEICYPTLHTEDCLNLIISSAERNPYAIHIGFGFNYDVSCILRELPWRCLNALYKFNRTHWRGFRIEHIPRKWFAIKRGDTYVKIFDCQSFFGTSLVVALEDWSIGPWNSSLPSNTESKTKPQSPSSQDKLVSGQIAGQESGAKETTVPPLATVLTMTERELVERFKKLRSEFQWKDIQQIAVYMRLELKYTKILMERLRDAFVSAGYLPRSWHGPGAVARMAFHRHGIYDVLTPSPPAVATASQAAFIAGRFELFKAGHVGKVYTADINSAYPWFTSQLPNLSRGTWRSTHVYEPGKFGIYHIKYDGKRNDPWRPYPLPYRDKHGNILWPRQVTGWYWNPEADLVRNDPDAEFLEGWVFDEDDETDRPFAFIASYYQQRKLWKEEGNPAQYTLKLIINSIYGQLAQRVGWDRKHNLPPKTHQLEYAGWITSSCRAMVYRVARRCGEHLVSIDTDGITSTRPFRWLDNSKELGGWELDSWQDSIFWQSGIYMLKNEDGWTKARTRGIPKGSYTAEDLFTALTENTTLKLTKKVFISYGLALQSQFKDFNKWREEPHEYKLGGAGKRFHHQRHGKCNPRRCHDGIHSLMFPSYPYSRLFQNMDSYPHKLPWLTNREDYAHKQYLIDLMLYDRNDTDFQDEWSLTDDPVGSDS